MSATEHQIIDAFEAAMRDAGIEPEFRSGQGIEFGQSASGNPRRFHVKGDSKGTRNGWYILFADGVPAGEFGSFKTGVRIPWCMKDKSSLSPEELDAINKRIEAARIEREKAQKQREGAAAKRANEIWQAASEVYGDDHPYLKRKGVLSHGLRRCSWPVRNSEGVDYRHIENTLIIPIINSKGKIVSLQAIFPEKDFALGRDKDFLSGGKKRGCFYMIGNPTPQSTVCICEGYATGETIHQITGWCIVVAWDAYNLVDVAKAMREALPHNYFVMAADNDQFTKTPVDNPGLTYAKRVVAEIGARLVCPEFTSLEGQPTDFNDLAEREGFEVTQSQLVQKVVAPTAPETEVTRHGYYSPIVTESVDLATPFPDVDGKGKPLPTPINLSTLVDRIGATVRYNVIAKDIEVLIPGLANTIDNQANASLAELLGWCSRARMSTANIDGNLCACADANPYNPVATWIDSTPWDGVSRLQQLCDTVTAKIEVQLENGKTLKEMLIKRWLISAVAAAFNRDGVVARGVLTFQSVQNLGKTKWIKKLAPKDLDVIADGLILNPADKDSVKICVSKWIVELGELDATFRRSDIAALKAFVSKDRDELRRPFARTESKYARRTVFFASVNGDRFLRDPTGNSRFWTVPVLGLDTDHKIDMQQLWAEMKTVYEAGESWHLTHEELAALNYQNQDHEEISPLHEMVDKTFDWDAPKTLWTFAMRATEIIKACGNDKPTKIDVNEAAAYVTSRYGVDKKKIGKERTTVWIMPPKRMGSDAPL